ncbi:MAG: hypothetical protein ABI402_19840 [Ferruginibacter sp.]
MKKQNDTHASRENAVIPIRENIDSMVNTAWQLTLIIHDKTITIHRFFEKQVRPL